MEVFVESLSGRVCCLYAKARGSGALAILAHGYLSDKASRTNAGLSSRLNAAGISTLAFDMYGHGESEGDVERLTVTKVVDNILAIYGFAEKEGYARIGLAGSSFSGSPSLISAAKLPFSALALKCPVFDGKRLSDERLGPEGVARWKREGFYSPFGRRWSYEVYEDESGYDMKSIASKINAPTLVVHGSRDVTVPISQAYSLMDALRCEKKLVVVDGADHFFRDEAHFSRMISESAGWLVSHLR
ncbi:MAG: alpha/beta fold hydrolase [Candidatus Micrarchaeota archaeon]